MHGSFKNGQREERVASVDEAVSAPELSEVGRKEHSHCIINILLFFSYQHLLCNLSLWFLLMSLLQPARRDVEARLSWGWWRGGGGGGDGGGTGGGGEGGLGGEEGPEG